MNEVHDWSGLEGLTVLIKRSGHRVRSGHVEAVTSAGDMLWLEGHGVEPRMLFQKDEGYEVWHTSVESAGDLNGTTLESTIVHVCSNEEGERYILSIPIE